jgi:hypothetical protein
MKNPVRLGTIIISVLFIFAGIGRSSIIGLSTDELINQADFVLIGDVIDIQTVGDPGDLKQAVTISLAQDLKGGPPNPVTAITNSMELGRYEATFSLDERVLVFLKSVGGELRVVGGLQGRISLPAGQLLPPGVSLRDFVSKLRGGL